MLLQQANAKLHSCYCNRLTQNYTHVTATGQRNSTLMILQQANETVHSWYCSKLTQQCTHGTATG